MQSTFISPQVTPAKKFFPHPIFTRPPPSTLRVAAQTPSSSAVTLQPSQQAPAQSRKLNKYSSNITEPKSQGGSQAILYGVGLNDDDMSKPQIGISYVWYEGNTCNMHLLRLSEAVREGNRQGNGRAEKELDSTSIQSYAEELCTCTSRMCNHRRGDA